MIKAVLVALIPVVVLLLKVMIESYREDRRRQRDD